MHKDELVVYENVRQQATLLGLPAPELVEIDETLQGGETLAFGESTARVIHTPGHSPGSVSIIFENEKPPSIFVGDVLDVEKERARLEKQRDKLTKQIEQGRRKLSNASFVEKAPAKVVDTERRRLEEAEAELALLEENARVLAE